MFKFIVVFATIIQSSESNFPSFELKVNPITACTLKLQTSFPEIFVAYYKNTSSDIEFIVKTLQAQQSSLQMINLSGNIQSFTAIPYKFASNILIIKTTKQFESFLTNVYGTAMWSPKGQYLVSYLGTEKADVAKIIELAWARYVLNINVVALIESELQIFTYFPYKNGQCGDHITPEVLKYCNESSIGNIFPEKVPSVTNGCSLRTLTNIYPPFTIEPMFQADNAKIAGLEINILNVLLQRLNMSRTTIQIRGAATNKKVNGSYDGALNYPLHNVTDIALGCLFPNVSFGIDLDISFLYYYINFSWIVPTARFGKQWHSLIYAFNKTLWLTILVVLLCNTVIWWIFGRTTSDRKGFKEFTMCFLKSWYSLLQGGIDLPFSLTMRVLVLFWTLFTLLLATLYQSQLCSILLTPVYEHQISTPRELVDSSVQIVYKHDFFVRLNNSNKQVDKEIIIKGKELSQTEHTAYTKTYQTNAAFLLNTATTLYLMTRNYSLPNGKPAMYICKETEFGNPITIWFRKGYPLLQRVNKLLLRFASSGLLAKWITEAASALPKGPESAEPQKLQISHMLGAFFILFIGYVGALFIFICETLVYYKKHKSN